MCSKWNIISVPALCSFAALRLIASDGYFFALPNFKFYCQYLGNGGASQKLATCALYYLEHVIACF